MNLDYVDLIAFIGLVLVGVSTYMLAGWMGMVGYGGALLAIGAAFVAYRRAGDL